MSHAEGSWVFLGDELDPDLDLAEMKEALQEHGPVLVRVWVPPQDERAMRELLSGNDPPLSGPYRLIGPQILVSNYLEPGTRIFEWGDGTTTTVHPEVELRWWQRLQIWVITWFSNLFKRWRHA